MWAQKVWLRQIVLRCPHHLNIEPPPHVHSQNGKKAFVGPHHHTKISRQKQPINHQGDSNEPPKIEMKINQEKIDQLREEIETVREGQLQVMEEKEGTGKKSSYEVKHKLYE